METTEKRITKKYSISFKKKAAELSYHRKNITEVAKELETSVKNLSRWRTEYKLGMYDDNYKPAIKSVDFEEIIRLKKENKNLQLENEILKKAMSIFCVDNRKSMNL